MNIAIISYHTCPLATLGGKNTGGMNVYIRDLTRFLGKKGIHADVFTRSQDDHVPHILHDLGFCNRVVHIPAGPEIPIPKIQLFDYLDQFSDGIMSFSESKGISYDIIFSHYWLSGLAANSLKEKWNIPFIQMFHTLAILKNQVAKGSEEMEPDLRVNGEKEVIRIADKIIASTSNEEKQLIHLYNADSNKIEVCPPGVDTSRFYPIPQDEAKEYIGIPKDEKMLLFVGRIEPLKGIDILIKAIAQMQKSDVLSTCPHYLFIIGGDPDADDKEMNNEMSKLRELCNQLGVGDMVLFLGKRDQDSLQYYYSAAEVVVMPSHYESFGLVALEAMACGIPVVATQVGGLQHLVQNGKTGFIIPDNDPIALEEKLTQLICNSSLRDQMSRASAKYAKSFAWENIAERLLEIFERTMN
jgi:D-inositol-3-phosphate glycosyltransferase